MVKRASRRVLSGGHDPALKREHQGWRTLRSPFFYFEIFPS
jgi:hypothetical protein